MRQMPGMPLLNPYGNPSWFLLLEDGIEKAFGFRGKNNKYFVLPHVYGIIFLIEAISCIWRGLFSGKNANLASSINP